MSPEQERLVLSHMPLVRAIAVRLGETLPSCAPIDDLIGAGNVALTWCVLNFDEAADVQFYAYAKFRVRGAMLDYLRTIDFASRELRRCTRRLGHLADELRRRKIPSKLSDFSTKAISRMVGFSPDMVMSALTIIHNSENGGPFEPILRGEDGIEFLTSPELLPDTSTIRQNARRVIKDTLQQLPKRYHDMAELYYFDGYSMKEVAGMFDVDESRVSKILKVVREKCRRLLLDAGLSSSDQITE